MSTTIKYFSRKGDRNTVIVYFFNASKITDEEALDAYENDMNFWYQSKGKMHTASVSEDNFVGAFSSFLKNAPCEAIQSFEIPDGRLMLYHGVSDTAGYAVWDKTKFTSYKRALVYADYASYRSLHLLSEKEKEEGIGNFFIFFSNLKIVQNIFDDGALETSETIEEYYDQRMNTPTE